MNQQLDGAPAECCHSAITQPDAKRNEWNLIYRGSTLRVRKHPDYRYLIPPFSIRNRDAIHFTFQRVVRCCYDNKSHWRASWLAVSISVPSLIYHTCKNQWRKNWLQTIMVVWFSDWSTWKRMDSWKKVVHLSKFLAL